MIVSDVHYGVWAPYRCIKYRSIRPILPFLAIEIPLLSLDGATRMGGAPVITKSLGISCYIIVATLSFFFQFTRQF